jgi:hypothetical protein
MKKKELPRLILHRETIQRLDPQTLKEVEGGDLPPSSQICCPSGAGC